MIVYPDLVLLQGFFLHFCAYSLALSLLDLVRPRWLLLVCSLLSAVTSVIAVIPVIPFVVPFFAGCSITVLLLRGKTARGTIRNSLTGFLIVFLVISGFLLFSGVVFRLSLLGTSDGAYLLLSFWEGLGSVGLASGLFWVLFRIRTRRKLCSAIYDCALYMEGKILPFRCFGDSGNLLTDPASGFPVVILEFSQLHKCFGDSFPRPLTYEFAERFGDRAKVISYRSVSGGGAVLSAFLPEDFRVNGISHKAVIAVTEEILEERGRFSGIIGPQLMEGVSI